MINCGLKIKKISLDNISEENVSITKNTLEKMWSNIQNEFNLGIAEQYKQKRDSIVLQEMDKKEKEKVTSTFDKTHQVFE
jgi:hypothetical protein